MTKSKIKKLKKILLIAALTFLIWIWADLSGDTLLTNKRATLRISPGLSRDTWVTLNGGSTVDIYLDIKGPAARIEELKRDSEPLEVFFTPPQEAESTAYQYPLMSLLERYERLNRMGLTVENVRPSTVEVVIEKLVSKQLKVVCIDEHNLIVDNVNIEPAFVDMPVREYWSGERLTAFVKLTPNQIGQLGTTEVTAIPYVEIDPQRYVYGDRAVTITATDEETEAKRAFALPGPRIGFVYNQAIADRFDVRIIERSDGLNTLQFLATEEAYELFRRRAYHVLIEVVEADITIGQDGKPEPFTKEVIYNFPMQSVREKKISPPRDVSWPTVTLQLLPRENGG